MIGYRCISNCLAPVDGETGTGNGTGGGGSINITNEEFIRFWSRPESWDSGYVPIEGENVEIKYGRHYYFDLEESPLYNLIQINGKVTFYQNMTKLHLRAKYIFVRAGSLFIGS